MARRDKDRDKDKEKEAKSDAVANEDPSEAETQPVTVDPDEKGTPKPENKPTKELPAIEPPDPKAEPWPDATPAPMKPVAPPPPAPRETPELRASRTPTATMTMPFASDLGKPPEMPSSSAPPPLALGAVENPTHLPGPKDVPAGDPDDPAPSPGYVPPGDSRSLRRGSEFALVYRVGSCVITRTGVVGTRGQWRVVEYPTSASAANSYAKECSRFVSEGFSDYRD